MNLMLNVEKTKDVVTDTKSLENISSIDGLVIMGKYLFCEF